MVKKKKKDDKVSIDICRWHILIGVCVLVGVWVVFLNIITPEEMYNENIHICIEETLTFIEPDWSEECTSWRDKTFCEFCHDDWIENCSEKCVCSSEVGDDSLPYKKYKDYLIEIVYNFYIYEDEYELHIYNLTTCHIEHNCIFEDESINSCERFCYEVRGFYLVDIVSPRVYCHGDTTREKIECDDGGHIDWIYDIENDICRLKELEEYNCKELKEKIFLGHSFCDGNKKWMNGKIFCWSLDLIKNDGIKQLYLNKGCEI